MTSRSDSVALIARVPGRLAALLATGHFVPQPGGWSSREEVLHLLVVESVVWRKRLDDLAALDDPHWSTTEPELGTDPDDRDQQALLQAFTTARAATVARVSALDEAGWLRAGTHIKYGRLDVEGLLHLALDHDEEHLARWIGR